MDRHLAADFSRMLKRIRPENLGREALIRAARIKDAKGELYAIDATAGMGEDSLLLAAAGFRVRMYEKNPVIFKALKEGLEAAKSDERLSALAGRMEVFLGDSIPAMRENADRVDVILLDPMFPKRTKSGLVKKKFQLLHEIETPCENEEEFLEAAFAAGPVKVVIKRPAKGEPLAGKKPDYSIKGSTIRYDCFYLGGGIC